MKMFRNLQIHQPESRFTSQLSTTQKKKGWGGVGVRESWPEVESGWEREDKILRQREYFPWFMFNKEILLCLLLKSGICFNPPLLLALGLSVKLELINLTRPNVQKSPRVLSSGHPNAGITCSYHNWLVFIFFKYGCWRVKLRSLCSPGQSFADWAIFPNPNEVF